MHLTPRSKLTADLILAAAAAVLAIVTSISREWIEFLFGVDPDGGSGAAEWGIVAGLGVVALAATLAARRQWALVHAGP